jgi:uncharacterized DUF497 family protein
VIKDRDRRSGVWQFLIVVHTFQKIDEIEVTKIISSRKATKEETKRYLERRR